MALPAVALDELEVAGFQCRAQYDGTYQIYYLVRDKATGVVQEMSEAELMRASPAAWEQMVVTQDIRWEGVSSVTWGMSTYAAQYKAEFGKVFSKYINGRSGTTKKPKFILGNETVPVTGTDPRTVMDNKNIIYMTADDQYFIGKTGTAAYMQTWWGSGGSVSLQDGKYTSPRKILETDGFFRSNHFDYVPDDVTAPSYNADVIIVHEFGHAFGYQHSPITCDYMAYTRHHVNAKALKKKTSNMWKLSFERDKLYYDDTYWTQARILPIEDNVLDIEYLHAPKSSDDSLDKNSYHPVVATNLKGHSGKKLQLAVYEGEVNVVPPPAKPIFTISGESVDYFIQMFSGYPFVNKYRLSVLNLGQEKYWKKLNKLVTKKGQSKTLDGVNFPKAVQATIWVSGYLDEDQTQKRDTSVVVWFVKK